MGTLFVDGDALRGWGRSSWMGTFFVDGDVHFPRSWPFGLRSALWLALLPGQLLTWGLLLFLLLQGTAI